MPIYEYRCQDCERRTSIWVQVYSAPSEVVCEHCGGENTSRVISRVAYHRSESDRLADLNTGRPQGEDYYRDDRNIGLWAKKRMKELGHDPGPEFESIVEKAKNDTKEMLSN